MSFNIGDKVVRKERFQGSWWTFCMAKHGLPPDHPLVIVGILDEGEIAFKEHHGSWFAEYFDLVEISKYKLEDFL